MPLQTDIPLSVQYRPAEDLGTKAVQMAQVADARAQAVQRVQQARDLAAINSAVQQTGGDWDKAADLLGQSGNATASAYVRAQADARRKALGDQIDSSLKRQATGWTMAGQVVNALGDDPTPEALASAKPMLRSLLGQSPNGQQFLDSLLPDGADPDTIRAGVDKIKALGQTQEQHTKAMQEAVGMFSDGKLDEATARTLGNVPPEKRPQMLALIRQRYGPSVDPVLAKYSNPALLNGSADDLLRAAGVQGKTVEVPEGGTLLQSSPSGGAPAPIYIAPTPKTPNNEMTVDGKNTPVYQDKQGNVYLPGSNQPIDPKRLGARAPAAVTTFNMIGPQGTPDQPSELAKSIAAYQTQMPTPRTSSPQAMAEINSLLKQVRAINPSYDAKNYTQASHFLNNSQAPLNSLNTAIEHLDQLSDVAAAMGNGNFKPGNALFNWFKTTFGDSAPTNFDGMKNIMSGELASAFKKSGATDQEIASVQANLDRSASPAQLQDYIKTIALPALASKAKTYGDQYHQMVGKDDPWSPYTPSALEAMERRGVNPDNPRVGTGGPATAKLPNGETVYDGQQVKQGGKVYTLHVDAKGNVTSTAGGG